MNMGTILRNLYRYDKAIFMYRGAIAAIAAAGGVKEKQENKKELEKNVEEKSLRTTRSLQSLETFVITWSIVAPLSATPFKAISQAFGSLQQAPPAALREQQPARLFITEQRVKPARRKQRILWAAGLPPTNAAGLSAGSA